ncbi:MAG: tetratricopeptide repeat protein [Candidatus Hydrogenedentes bacterium]|jgi:tetratricopeptide (TPR) repeat protein|nr:tetratricopeptide repeat protein [Candidatus Hydrogenedentota bacterium]
MTARCSLFPAMQRAYFFRIRRCFVALLFGFMLGLIPLPARADTLSLSSDASYMTSPAGASRELSAAKRMMKAGEYSTAIPRLTQIISKYPGSSAGVEARYHLGDAYFNLGAYSDALRCIQEYLDLAPQGDYVESSQALIGKMTDTAAQATPTEQEAQIAALEAAIAEEPDNMVPRLELAELLWSLGSYQEAGAVYTELLRRWPKLESDVVVRQRIQRDETGQLVVLTPEEVERQYREAEPLKIYNVSSFRSGRFETWPATASERYYNVTGQAVNQGTRPLNDVRVVVTIYGLGQMVFDTKTVVLGSLRPGEVRAFSAQFSSFDNIYNISRHECVGSFQR